MNIVAVVGMRWIARGARTGPASVTLWALAWIAFFVPLAVPCSALAQRYPDQGGVYTWVRRAFGPGHGFICGWCLWVNNLFYFPSVLLFGAANFAAMGGPRVGGDGRRRAGIRSRSCSPASGSPRASTSSGCARQVAAERRQPRRVDPGRPARSDAARSRSRDSDRRRRSRRATMVPRGNLLDTIGLWSAMCFAFSGFEITSLIGQEIRDPERHHSARHLHRRRGDDGRSTSLGSASVLVAVPVSSLKELSGITDAVQLVAGRVGLTGLGALTGGLLALNALAGTASWTAGAARVPFAAGVGRGDAARLRAAASALPHAVRRADRPVDRRVARSSWPASSSASPAARRRSRRRTTSWST